MIQHENGLNIGMWNNSDGDQILRYNQKNISKMNLSADASEILKYFAFNKFLLSTR